MPSFDTETEFLTTQQAAEFLSLKPTTLNQWRWSGKGPKYVRIGERTIRYRHQDLQHWINSFNWMRHHSVNGLSTKFSPEPYSNYKGIF